MKLARDGLLLLLLACLTSCHTIPEVWVDQMTVDAAFSSYPVMLSTVAQSQNLTTYDLESGWSSRSLCLIVRTGPSTYVPTSSSYLQSSGEHLHQQIFAAITPSPDSPKPDWVLLSQIRIRAMLANVAWMLDVENYTTHVQIGVPASAEEK